MLSPREHKHKARLDEGFTASEAVQMAYVCRGLTTVGSREGREADAFSFSYAKELFVDATWIPEDGGCRSPHGGRSFLVVVRVPGLAPCFLSLSFF